MLINMKQYIYINIIYNIHMTYDCNFQQEGRAPQSLPLRSDCRCISSYPRLFPSHWNLRWYDCVYQVKIPRAEDGFSTCRFVDLDCTDCTLN